jgi:hypothetical protein
MLFFTELFLFAALWAVLFALLVPLTWKWLVASSRGSNAHVPDKLGLLLHLIDRELAPPVPGAAPAIGLSAFVPNTKGYKLAFYRLTALKRVLQFAALAEPEIVIRSVTSRDAVVLLCETNKRRKKRTGSGKADDSVIAPGLMLFARDELTDMVVYLVEPPPGAATAPQVRSEADLPELPEKEKDVVQEEAKKKGNEDDEEDEEDGSDAEADEDGEDGAKPK